jgi:DNA-directed RNA polymerase specialized sigma subunit
MLDYKNIIIKSYVLHMTGREIAESLHVSQSGVNGFLTVGERRMQSHLYHKRV